VKRPVWIFLLLVVRAVPAAAHHGRDFLIVESWELPHPHAFYLVTSEELHRVHGETAFHTEPSLLFGIRERVAGEVHVHAEREPGQSFRYEAIAPSVHVQLTPPESNAPWRFAASAEYEFARRRAADNAALTLIAARSAGEAALIFNAGVERQQQGTAHAVYALGFRPRLDAPVTWGLEAAGRLHRGQSQQLLFGVYLQPSERLTVKIGAGAGLGNGRPAAVVRSGIVWSFQPRAKSTAK